MLLVVRAGVGVWAGRGVLVGITAVSVGISTGSVVLARVGVGAPASSTGAGLLCSSVCKTGSLADGRSQAITTPNNKVKISASFTPFCHMERNCSGNGRYHTTAPPTFNTPIRPTARQHDKIEQVQLTHFCVI